MGIILNDRVGRIENHPGGAVILFQLNDFDLRIILLQIENIGNLRPAPAVDALVVIAHHAHIPVFLGEQMHQLVLGGVGVLILIHRHILIALPAFLQSVWMFLK